MTMRYDVRMWYDTTKRIGLLIYDIIAGGATRCTMHAAHKIWHMRCHGYSIRLAPPSARAHVDRTGGPWAAGLLWSGLSCVLTSTVSLERKARDAERKKRKRAEQKAARDAAAAMRQVKGSPPHLGGGTIYHVTKKIPLIVDSSMETEALVSAKAGEQIAPAREILRSLGVPPLRPTLIGTDNLANYKVATGVGCPSRSRHFLRRYFVLKHRIASGEVTMVDVPDVQMPADCLTKWLGIPSDKVRRSVDYMTNRRAAPPQATAAYSEITLNDITDAIANVSDHSHDGNLHDRAYQVWGSVVSDPVSTVRLDLPLRPPLRACQGEGRSGGSASCPLLRLLTIGKTWPAPNTPTSYLHRPSGSVRLTFERPRPRLRSRDRSTVAAARRPPTADRTGGQHIDFGVPESV